jgi:hypothetical protein
MNTEFKELGTVIPSPGGCDERIKLYFTRVNCTKAVLAHLEGKLGGVLLENEMITARVRPVSLVRKQILSGDLTDAKLISAMWFYDNSVSVRKWSCLRRLTMNSDGRPQLEMPPLGCFASLMASFQRWRATASATASRSWHCHWPQGWSWHKNPTNEPTTEDTKAANSIRVPHETQTRTVFRGQGITIPGQIE